MKRYCADDVARSSSITVTLDSWEFWPEHVMQCDLQANAEVDNNSGSAQFEVVDPRKLPVPEIICHEPAEDEDSLRCRKRPGIGTATGDVRLFDSKGEHEPWPTLSLFWEL